MALHYKKQRDTLYRRVAKDISTMISNGVYSIGSKIPSIREMSHNMSVSINTIREAYTLLENNGLIEGRPHVGFFVKDKIVKSYERPVASYFEPLPSSDSEAILYQNILKEIMDTKYIPLGATVSSPSLLPLKDFNHLINSLSEEQRNLALAYAPTEGLPQLRVAIVKKLVDCGLHMDPEEVVITSGCEEALTLALSSVTKEGDSVAVQAPVYCNLILTLKNLGLNLVEIPGDDENGVTPEVLQYVIEHNNISACLLISNFNNPSGTLMTNENKREVTELLREYDIPLIEDDVYGDLYFGDKRPSTCKTYDSTGNTILCSSFSKTVSPGLRVGYIIPGRYKDRVVQRKMGMNICTSTISQLLLFNYLESGGYYKNLRKLRGEVGKRMKQMRHDVLTYFPPGTRANNPQGGFSLWVELPGGLSGLELYNRVIKEGIAIVPGGLFSLRGSYESYIRLNAGAYTEEVREAIKTLAKIIYSILY